LPCSALGGSLPIYTSITVSDNEDDDDDNDDYGGFPYALALKCIFIKLYIFVKYSAVASAVN
jgi:hypothetical protein